MTLIPFPAGSDSAAFAAGHAVAAVAHALAGAAWFGSMFYSLAVLQPRAKAYFEEDDGRFEEFVATIAGGRGNRFRSEKYNGEGEIRTPATLSGRPVFETGAFNHSATSPGRSGGV